MKSIYCLIAWNIAGIALAQQSNDWVTRGFPLGGVDRDSYIYWPSKPVDSRPLELLAAGKRDDAFKFCLQKMDTTRGNSKYFYAVQASTIGFSLGKSHLVYAKLRQTILPPKIQSFYQDLPVSKEDWLLLGFVIAVCDRMQPPNTEWMKNRGTYNEIGYASRATLNVKFESLVHTWLHGSMATLLGEYPIARKSLESATIMTPDSSMAWLALARVHFIARSDVGPTLTELMKIGVKHISKARRLDPSNGRALFLDGVISIAMGQNKRGIELLEKFLESADQLVGETESAKRAIALAQRRLNGMPGAENLVTPTLLPSDCQ